MTGKMGCRICDAPLVKSVNNFDVETYPQLKRICRKAECIIAAFKRPRKLDALERRSARLMSTYNMTHVDYVVMLYGQNNGCAICGAEPAKGQHLAIDHDHKTGAVRGLLCTSCNLKLGWYENNRQRILRYLNQAKVNRPR